MDPGEPDGDPPPCAAKTLALITARDIRQVRETHRQLQLKEAELRRVIASVSDCLWSASVDSKGQWIFRTISPVVTRILGSPAEHFLRGVIHWRALIHPEDRSHWDGIIKHLVRPADGNNRHIQQEYRVLWQMAPFTGCATASVPPQMRMKKGGSR